MLPISEMPVWILLEGVTLLVSYYLLPSIPSTCMSTLKRQKILGLL